MKINKLKTTVILFATLLIIRSAIAAPGDLDPAFNSIFGLGGGKVKIFANPTSYDRVYDVAIQTDGKILVGGETSVNGSPNQLFLVRLMPNGTLDSSFGSGGKVILSIQNIEDSIRAIKIQVDGKIVVTGGTFSAQGRQIYAARFLPNGQLDASFGVNGITKFSVGFANPRSSDCLITQSGQIVVIGTSEYQTGKSDFLLVRLNSNGAIDPTFGNNGVVLGTTFPQAVASEAVLLNDKILVTGFTDSNSNNPQSIYLAKYLPTGALDTTFGIGGKVVTNINSSYNLASNRGLDIAVFPTGFVVAGFAADKIFPVLKYNSSGGLDATFGNSPPPIQPGVATLPIGYNVTEKSSNVSIAVDGNFRILTAGMYEVVVDPFHPAPVDRFGVARFNPNGTPDLSFGTNGLAFNQFGDVSFASKVAIQTDGKIVVVGGSISGSNFDIVVARYLP